LGSAADHPEPLADREITSKCAPSGSLVALASIDVRKGLRPHPLPSAGDLVSAAGPVQTGSYGQGQIHAQSATSPAGDEGLRAGSD
jgi:hypothetical protein